MLTLDATLQRALEAGDVYVRRIVTFTMAAGVSHSFVDGEDGFEDAAGVYMSPSVLSVEPQSMELDPVTREVTFGEFSVRMSDDGAARALLVNQRAVGRLVTVRLGVEAASTTNYVTICRGTIDRFTVHDNGEVTFHCIDGFAVLAGRAVTYGCIATHPLEVQRELLDTYAAADLWSSSGFDFETDTTRSHWSISRYEERLEPSSGLSDRALAERADRAYRRMQFSYRKAPFTDGLLDTPQEAWGLLQELSAILGGTLRLNAAGQLERVAYDPDAAVVRHWTEADYGDRGDIDSGTVVNRAEVTIALAQGTNGSPFIAGGYDNATDRIYADDDAASQTALGTPGSGVDGVFTGEIKSPWLRALALVTGPTASSGADPVLTDVATTLYVQRASRLGFSGARYRYGFRGATGGGGIAVTAASITANVATLECAGHWLETGAYITTSGLTTNVSTPTAVTVVDADTITVPLVGADGVMADGSGFIHPEQDPLDTLADGRVAWLMIVQTDDPDDYEIVRATAGQAEAGSIAESDSREVSLGRYSHPQIYQYTIERAQMGTVAQEFAGGLQTTVVYDITIAVDWATRVLARHAYGAPTMTLRTGLRELAVQLGDFITLDDPTYVGYLADGADADGPVFEVVSKNVDEGSIEWGLAYVRDDA